MVRGWTLVEMGRFEEGFDSLDAASADPEGQPGTFIWSQVSQVFRSIRVGDSDRAMRYAQRAAERAAADNVSRTAQVAAQVGLASARVATGRHADARDAGLRALELDREYGVSFGVAALARCALSASALGRGEVGKAVGYAEEAVADASESGAALFLIDATLSRVAALATRRLPGDLGEARGALESANALVAETGAHRIAELDRCAALLQAMPAQSAERV